MRSRRIFAVALLCIAVVLAGMSWAAYVLYETALDAVLDVGRAGTVAAVLGVLLAIASLVIVKPRSRAVLAVSAAAVIAGAAAAGVLVSLRFLPFAVQEVRIASGDVIIAGSLHQPRGRQLQPAVVLVQGSGPESRAEYAFYARYLARRGIAALAYDKRGVGRSTGDLYGDGYDDDAHDVVAAVQRLRSVRGIDPDRVGIVGFSAAEWVAPLAAARDTSIAFIALIGASGLSPAGQVSEEMALRLRSRGYTEDDVGRALDLHEQVLAYQRSGDQGEALNNTLRAAAAEPWFEDAEDLPREVRPLATYAWGEWWRKAMDVAPDSLWEQVRVPVLLLKGGRDDRSPPQHLQRIVAAAGRSGNDAVTVEVFRDADHMLLEWPRAGRPPVFAEGYLEKLARWIRGVE